jgi:uncharacterized LabA/DUF88 family protein
MKQQVMKTTIYIDGYNLYYGRLRNTEFKWLDIVTLFSNMAHTIEPRSSVVAVKYFTAPALSKFARHGNASMQAQNDYHRALEAKYPQLFSITLGSHVYEKDGTSLPIYIKGVPFDKNKSAKVWRLVEKKTDVNIAMAMYRDASKGVADQLILVSNDSDAEPVLQAISEDFPNLILGLVMPLALPEDGKRSRPPSRRLASLAHWNRSYIRDDELKNALLPAQVPTRKKPATKPVYW